jgi:hypothetical protein
MSCEEMREMEEVEKELEQIVEEAPESLPSKEEIVEEVHQEAHKLMDLQKLLFGKPNLKKIEMAPLIIEAKRRVFTKLDLYKYLPLKLRMEAQRLQNLKQ